MKKIVLILIVISTITIGCSKYDRTLKKIYALYTIQKYEVDGIDSLDLYKKALGLNFNFYYQEENDINCLQITGITSTGVQSHYHALWSLNEDNKTLKFRGAHLFYGLSTGPFGTGINLQWQIVRLTNRYFEIKTNYNGKEYYLVL